MLCTEFPCGDYVFTGGRSRRDFVTFCLALRTLGYPAVIVTSRSEEAVLHETYIDNSLVPNNVRIIHDDGTPESWIHWISGSRLVVLCISDDSISPSGVGVYLEAMGVGKCVIITDCPASRDILENGNQAIIVERGNVAALTDAIQRAWEDLDYRNGIARRGREYAASLGGECDLNQRFSDVISKHFE